MFQTNKQTLDQAMESKIYSKLFTVVKNNEDQYEYCFDEVIKNGSLLDYIVKNYNFSKLKEILNYHSIEHKINLLNCHQDNDDIILQLIKIYSKEKYMDIHRITYDFTSFSKYSKILKYLIINGNTDQINYIVDYFSNDVAYLIWNYSNKSMNFKKNKDYDWIISDVLMGTLINIIMDTEYSLNINNFLHTINLACKLAGPHYYHLDFQLELFLAMLHYKKLDIEFDKLKEYVKINYNKLHQNVYYKNINDLLFRCYNITAK